MTDSLSVMPPADKAGVAGRAWRCDLDALRSAMSVPADHDATIASWIIEAPWAHPVWHSYNLVLVHLRPMPVAQETIFYRPDASHEFWINALVPTADREPMLRSQPASCLMPVNFAAQLAEPTDAAAQSVIEGAVELIVAGELSPDTDAMWQWVALFGSAMIKSESRAR